MLQVHALGRVTEFKSKSSKNIFEIFTKNGEAAPSCSLWRMLDLCVKRPDTLVDLDCSVGFGPVANASIIGPLTTRYAVLAPTLKVLCASRNSFDDSTHLGAFAMLATQLCVLIFKNCGLSSVAGLKGHCKLLRKVDLSGCERLCSLDGLEDRHNLEVVDVSGTAITTVELLLRCPLREVRINGCKALTSLEGLQGHAHLHTLSAACCILIDTVEVLQTCPALVSVDVSGCRKLRSLAGLGRHNVLKELDASKTPIGSIRELASCPALTKVNIKECKEVDSIAALENHEFLQHVDASKTGIMSPDPLRSCPELKIVDICQCPNITYLVDVRAGVRVLQNVVGYAFSQASFI